MGDSKECGLRRSGVSDDVRAQELQHWVVPGLLEDVCSSGLQFVLPERSVLLNGISLLHEPGWNTPKRLLLHQERQGQARRPSALLRSWPTMRVQQHPVPWAVLRLAHRAAAHNQTGCAWRCATLFA